MGFISHQFLLHTYKDNTNRYPQDSKREHEYDCHEELFGIFYKKSAKRSNKFWSDHDSSSISKRNVYFGVLLFYVFMVHTLTESEQGGAAGASSHSLNNNGRNMSNDQ